MIEKLSLTTQDSNGTRFADIPDVIHKINEIIDNLNERQNEPCEDVVKPEYTYALSKTQLLKILSCLLHANFYGSDLSESERHELIDMSDDMQWDIAEIFNINLNEGFIDPVTLKYVEY